MAQRRFHGPAKLLLFTLISFSLGGTAFAQQSRPAEGTKREREISTQREMPTTAPQTSPANGAGQQAGNTVAYTPMTSDEKMKYAFRSAFLRPEGYLFSAVSAAITESSERRQPQKSSEDRFADGLSRFARNFATRSVDKLLGSGVYPVIFRQDSRYEHSPKKGFGTRSLYAASREFVTRGDDGRMQPNYSRLLGSLSASAIANVYERSTPGHKRIGAGPTFQRFGTSVAFGMLANIFREFWSRH